MNPLKQFNFSQGQHIIFDLRKISHAQMAERGGDSGGTMLTVFLDNGQHIELYQSAASEFLKAWQEFANVSMSHP